MLSKSHEESKMVSKPQEVSGSLKKGQVASGSVQKPQEWSRSVRKRIKGVYFAVVLLFSIQCRVQCVVCNLTISGA